MNVTVTKENESVIYNGKIYTHGQSFDVDDIIGESLVERGYVSVTGQEAAAEADSFEDLTYPELKKLAAERGVAATGKREEILARLRAADTAEETESEEEETESEDDSAGDLPNTGMPE